MNSLDKKIVRTGKIELEVALNAAQMPVSINWSATDQGPDHNEECGAFMLSMWDREKKEQLKINLWELEMTVEEMKHFFFQSLMSMSGTLQLATGEKEEAEKLREFAIAYGKRNGVIKE